MYDACENEIHMGDRIMVVAECEFGGNTDTVGKTGTVVVTDDWYDIGVEFDEPIEYGHDCAGHATNERGCYGYASEVLLCEDTTIEITIPFDNFMTGVKDYG